MTTLKQTYKIIKIANSFYVLNEYNLPTGELASDILFRTTSKIKANNFLNKSLKLAGRA